MSGFAGKTTGGGGVSQSYVDGYTGWTNASIAAHANIAVSKLAASTVDGYVLATASGVPVWQSVPAGVSAHSALTGLTVGDDHTQYVHISNVRNITARHNFNNGFNVNSGTDAYFAVPLKFGTDGYSCFINNAKTGTVKAVSLDASDNIVIGSGASNIINVRNDGYIDFNASIMNITNANAIPISTPVGGVYMYAQLGALKARGTSGTITTIAPADPHCKNCGRDFSFEGENISGEKLSFCFWCLVEEIQRLGGNLNNFIIEKVSK